MFYSEEYVNVKKGGPFSLVWLAGTLRVSNRFYKENGKTIEKLMTRSFGRRPILKIDVSVVTEQIIKAIRHAYPNQIPRSVNQPPRFSLYFSSVLSSGVCIVQRLKSAIILDNLTLCCKPKLHPKPKKKRVLEWDDTNANWNNNEDSDNSQELDESIQMIMDCYETIEDNDPQHTDLHSQIDLFEDNLALRMTNKADEGFGPEDDLNLSLFIMEHGIQEVLNFKKPLQTLMPMSEPPHQGRHPHVNVPEHPDVVVPEHPDVVVPEHPDVVVPEHPDVDVPEHPDVVVPEHPHDDVPEHPHDVVPERPQEGDSVPASTETAILEQPDLSQDSAPVSLEQREQVVRKKPQPQDVEQDMFLEPLEEQPSIQRGQKKRKRRLQIDESIEISHKEFSRRIKNTFFATCAIEDAQIPAYFGFITQAQELLTRPGTLQMGSKLQSLFKQRFQSKEHSEISQINIVGDNASDLSDQIQDANAISEHLSFTQSRSELHFSIEGRQHNVTVLDLEDAVNKILPRDDQGTKRNTSEAQLIVEQPLELPVPEDMSQIEVAVVEQPSEENVPEGVAVATQGDSGPLPPPQLIPNSSVDPLPSTTERGKRKRDKPKDKGVNKTKKPRTELSDMVLQTFDQLTLSEKEPQLDPMADATQLDPMADATQLDKGEQVCEPGLQLENEVEHQQSPRPCEGFSDSHPETPSQTWEKSNIETMVLDLLQKSNTGTINILDLFQGKNVIRQQAAYAFSVLLGMHNRNLITLHQDQTAGSGPITITFHE